MLLEALTQSHYQHLLTLALWSLPLRDEGAANVASFLQSNRTFCALNFVNLSFQREALEKQHATSMRFLISAAFRRHLVR